MAGYGCFYPDHRLLAALPPEVICPDDRHAAAGQTWELCALTPSGAARLGAAALQCRTLLVPEDAYHAVWQAEQLVGYGLSGRSTLTLSSMDTPGVLCVQRRLRTCPGAVVEEGERRLCPRWSAFSARERLLLAGIWLLVRGDFPA